MRDWLLGKEEDSPFSLMLLDILPLFCEALERSSNCCSRRFTSRRSSSSDLVPLLCTLLIFQLVGCISNQASGKGSVIDAILCYPSQARSSC
mmetsp:Transcript_16951/g.30759  ORF Transcript_16951/g.30759 Transcript_16951/m.30759 type:complete len:92 (-) Transcript_16951:110-385(-)